MYENISRVLVYHNSFYLILGTEEVPSMVYPKSSFTVGTAHDYEAFIQAKKGKTIEYIE